MQSLRTAVAAGLVAISNFCVIWVLVSELTGRIFPWTTFILGCLVGYAVRRTGRGIEWPFPVVSALLTLLGSVFANVVIAASVSADQLGVGTLHVLRSVTSMTWPVFFDEVWNASDTVYALSAAALAAFMAPRRLNRDQYYALRLWREEQTNG